MRILRPAPLLLLGLLASGSSGCGTTRFTVTRRAPAEVNIPAGKVMAVASISGRGGDALASELSQALLATQRFQVLERQHLAAAIAELKFSSEGYVSDETAISFGNMTGAATLVVGDVNSADYKESVASAQQQCAKDGVLVACTHYTRTAVASLRVVLKVVETETGKLMAAKTLNAQQQRAADAIDTEPAAFGAQDEMLAQCRADVIKDFIAVIAPHDQQVLVALRSDDDLPELETGNNFARIGNWTAAVEQYRAAVTRSAALKPGQQAKALYDLGIGLGYSGAFDEGIQQVERAYALDPDELYLEQAGAIRRFKEEAAKLAAQEQGAPRS